jgi:tocopherol cyclase
MLRLFKPEVFQGSLKRKNYFEGWYFKNVSADQESVLAFIPGISLTKNDAHAFIQVINGITGESKYVTYPLNKFNWRTDTLFVQVGESVFTDSYIDINIQEPGFIVKGRLDYNGLSKYPKSLLSPGIMGWYSYVPFMECYHGVVSANHGISGKLEINHRPVIFSGGKGYIEKDWGTSFPECWIWLQSNSFVQTDASVFVSIAKIPWLGKFFMGFIAFVYLSGSYYKFATYNRSKLTKAKLNGQKLELLLENSHYILLLEAVIHQSGELLAPKSGIMNRRIKESIDSEVHVTLTHKNGTVIFDDSSNRAGIEIINSIFRYL